MKCHLCKTNEADKSNTHYLTDFIIRRNINEDGSKERDKGLYIDMSSQNSYTEVNFQQSTSPEKVEEMLGREITEEDIEKAKEKKFAVDNYFCSDCEKLFTSIENDFADKYINKFRGVDLSAIESISIKSTETLRLFFYIQIWRTHICHPTYEIPEEIAEDLRVSILNYGNNGGELKKRGLYISYLETLGEDKSMTQNAVGCTNESNPYVIFFADFVLLFYPDNTNLNFYDFYGLCNKVDYSDYINIDEDEFVFKIVSDKNRQQFLLDYYIEGKMSPVLDNCRDNFKRIWKLWTHKSPDKKLVDEYISYLINKDPEGVVGFSRERILKKTEEFLKLKLG